jgi:Uma2 family endonuclease
MSQASPARFVIKDEDQPLVTNRKAQFVTEPDGTFVSWATSEAGRIRMVPRKGHDDECLELQGTPDWILEIISQSSRKKDTRTLRDAYHDAGIREYWLLDARGEEIDFRILVRRRARYIETQAEEGWHRSPVFGQSFRLVRRRNRMGRWSYRLEHR